MRSGWKTGQEKECINGLGICPSDGHLVDPGSVGTPPIDESPSSNLMGISL
jgi:hypothetical protein